MDSKNRVLRVMCEHDEQQKQELLTDLHNYIAFGDGTPLNTDERDTLLAILRARDESITILVMLWRFALESPFHPPIEHYAREIVEQSQNSIRCFVAFWLRLRHSPYFRIREYKRFAISYLQLHNSAYFVQHFERFTHERDPYVLYEVACEIGKSSVSQKIAMLIQLYHRLPSHELYEIFTAEILAHGTEEHLAIVRDIMARSRKRHIYREIEAGLEAKLSSEL